MGEITINPIHNVHKKYRTMNFVNPYIFALPVDLTTNTEIGGVASTISTPALLATKLGIDVSRITNFSTVGSDIKCKITGSYVMPISCWADRNGTTITYYEDIDGLCIGAEGGALKTHEQCKMFYLPNCAYIKGELNKAFAYNTIGYKTIIYVPNCINWGVSQGLDGNVFDPSTSNFIVYTHPSMQTSNSGGVEGDLSYFVSRPNNALRYVSNKIAPNPVTTLSIGTIYNTAVQLNFTAPVGSTNTIEYYEVYVNGVYYSRVTASGQYVTGLNLNTTYSISVYAIDVLFNKSIMSNVVSSTTTNTAITTLSIGTIYNTAVQLNFTAPSSGVYNPTGLYKIYVDGIYNNTVAINGLAVGLTPNTSYSISVYAIDGIGGLGSVISNIVTPTTATAQNGSVPTTGLVSYYKLDETSGSSVADSYGSSTLNNSGITINQIGIVKKSYLATVNLQKLSSTTASAITGNFTINFWILLMQTPTSGYTGVVEHGSFSAGFGFWIDTSRNLSWRINSDYNHYSSATNVPLNLWTMVSLVYNGSTIKAYINKVEKISTSYTTNPGTSNVRTLFYNPNNGAGFLGKLSEVSFHNVALTQTNIDTLFNGGAGITL